MPINFIERSATRSTYRPVKIYTSGNVSTFEGCFPNSAESPEKLRLQYPHVSRIGRSSNPGRDKSVVYKIKMVVKTLDSRYEYNGFSEMIPPPSRMLV